MRQILSFISVEVHRSLFFPLNTVFSFEVTLFFPHKGFFNEVVNSKIVLGKNVWNKLT